MLFKIELDCIMMFKGEFVVQLDKFPLARYLKVLSFLKIDNHNTIISGIIGFTMTF